MRTILYFILLLSPFFTFTQSDSIPHHPKNKLAGCEEVPGPPLTKAYKDSIFNLHKIKIVDIEENEVDDEIVEDYVFKGDSISNYANKPNYFDAEYPGGTEKMIQFIHDGLDVSNCDLNMVSSTKIYVVFRVLKNGNITNIKIVKGVSTCVDNSVIEMIKKMPKWIPAEFEGQLLDSTFELPIQLDFE